MFSALLESLVHFVFISVFYLNVDSGTLLKTGERFLLRRPAGKSKASVIATVDELDAWVTALDPYENSSD